MSTFHCKQCCRAIFRAADILEKVNLWDLGEYQAECYAISRGIDLDGSPATTRRCTRAGTATGSS